jgi:hypothetical protein
LIELPEAAAGEEPEIIMLRTDAVGRLAREYRAFSFLLEDLLILKDYSDEAPPRRAVGFRPTRDSLTERARGRPVKEATRH